MDNFERRLAASMKIAAVQRPDVEPESINSNRSNRRAGFLALAAAVLVGAVIAGTTWLFNPGDSLSPTPSILHPTNVVPWTAVPGPRPSPDLGAPLAGKPIKVTLDLPGYQRQSTPSSARYKFVVRLSNTGDEPVALDPCPFYRVQFVKDVETGYLNCGQAPSEIAAGGHVDFEMEAPAHDAEYLASSGGNDFGLLWQLGTEGSEGATAEGTAHLASPAEPVDLEGEWTLTALVGSDGQSVLTDSYANRSRGISFENGRFEGTAGCNSLFGVYRQAGNNGRDLEFTQVGTTKMACPNESPFRERLRAVRHVSEVNGTLRLHDRYWTIIAVLERAAAPATPASTLPDSVHVTCSADGIDLDEERIQTQPAGVSLVISSTLPKGSYLSYGSSGQGGDSGGNPLPDETTQRFLSLAPGTVTLGCDLP